LTNTRGTMNPVLTFIVILILVPLYFLPSILAFRRDHAYKNIILVINLVFGLTGFGWAGSLIWAIYPSEKSLIDPIVGNVTGTGLKNAGDTIGEASFGIKRGADKEAQSTREIKEASDLFKSGHISEEEFKLLKKKIIQGK